LPPEFIGCNIKEMKKANRIFSGLFSMINIFYCGMRALGNEQSPEAGNRARNLGFHSAPIKLFFPVEKLILENGLTVLLHEDHSVPMISYHTWYKVGSKDESEGVTGAAHMLEHMMFKGAKDYSGSDFDKILHLNGMSNNAFTTNDYTGFYQELPPNKLELMMKIEVDRMSNLALKSEDLLSEKEVVKEERRWRIDNNPMGQLNETMMENLFKVSRYHWPVIGYMKDIEDYDSAKLRHFYDTYYGPNNAILVLVGDFQVSQVKPLLAKYYGSLKPKHFEERPWIEEILLKQQKKVKLKKNVETSTLAISFGAPKVGDEDSFALDLAANVLAAGSSSRLHREFVVNKSLATMAFANNWTLKHQGVFFLGGSFKPGITVGTQVLAAFKEEINKLKIKRLSQEELDKAKTMVIKEHVDGLTTIDGKARALAINEILTGDFNNLFNDLEKYHKISPENVQAAVKKYLNFENSSIVILEPLKTPSFVKKTKLDQEIGGP